MEEEQAVEPTPLQSVKDCCRGLRQDWQAMMHNVDIASSQVLASLKAQEDALTAERAAVQSLRQETDFFRRSFLQRTQEQEKKTVTERLLANQISQNIHNQLMEVKKMQHQLASQLAKLRSIAKSSRKKKMDESLVPSVLASEKPKQCNSHSCQAVDRMGLNMLAVTSSVQADSTTKDCIDIKEDVSRMSETVEQNYMKGNRDTLSRTRCASNMRSRNNERGSSSDFLAPEACKVIPAEKLMGIQSVLVKREPEQETCNGEENMAICAERITITCGGLDTKMDHLDNVPLIQRLECLKQKIYDEQHINHSTWHDPELKKNLDRTALQRSSRSKRKWDVPIQIALQEDAPGLLQKLEEKGLVDDMIVYSGFCEDYSVGGDDPFKDLECIAKKVWSTTGLFKVPQVIRQQASSGPNKAPVYCLSCLVSLIDQAKSLKQRSWPVEWGWCRELQAFIFVFDKHNRIVLERPEYGNATYFFELVESLPVRWQVLRMIRVLSVTALGKTALLENKPLEVGYELTDDESKILQYYGWAPSTGLGSFLNFCGRVVHDAKEDDNLDWRQKIGKCLMDGYDKGRIIMPALQPRLDFHANGKLEEVTTKASPVSSTATTKTDVKIEDRVFLAS